MVTGDSCELTIQRLVAGGDGLGYLDGLAVFVPLSAPGDVLSVRLREVRKDYARAEILELVDASPQRVDAACPLYGECGGCNLMHLSYEAQSSARLDIFLEAFRRTGIHAASRNDEAHSRYGDTGTDPNRCLPADVDMAASAPFGYRNRAQFHLGPGGTVGYARRSSNAIIPVRDCPILVQSLRDWLGTMKQGSMASGFARSASPGPAGKSRFVAFGSSGRVWVEGRDSEVQVEVGGKSFLFNIQGFFQSNLTMLGQLVTTVCNGMYGARAADLYAGIGLFGAFLKDSFDRVVCVEQDIQAVGYACRNVGRDADFAAIGIKEWTASTQAKSAYDYVVVDPPRSGLAPAIRNWLGRRRPPVIGYVSCDPVSLARDAAELVSSGYHIEQSRLFDFYPQTGHVDSYVRFRLD
ncbi:MAG: TRAM domain-containing protein [Spirochaetota bacterium]